MVCNEEKRRSIAVLICPVGTIIRNSQSHIFLYKVKLHSRIAGNEWTDVLAKFQGCHHDGNSLPAQATICTAGPGGNPFFDISLLAVKEVYQQGLGTEAPQQLVGP